MDATQVFTAGQQGLWILLTVSAPMLLAVLVIGLVVSIFQAATQISEATLSFVPKIIGAALVLTIAGPWMMTTLVEYLQRTLQAIPAAVGGEAAILTLTDTQFLAWISPIVWPFVRTLALFGSLPVFAQGTVPRRIRVALAFFIAVAAQPALPAMPAIPLDSMPAALAVVQQVLIGLSMGFAVRIVYAAIEFAGEMVGLQMGLNFAGFYSPMTGGEATATSRFYGLFISWLFIATSGHLLLIGAVVQSFHAFPAGPEPFAFLRVAAPERWGAEVFRLGLWLALPVTAMLFFVNLVLGIVSRVAQQLNVLSIGFPVTLGVGLVGMMLTLPMLQTPFAMALERMLQFF